MELPPIGDRWGGFGDGAGDARAAPRRARHPRRQPRAREARTTSPRTEFRAFLADIHRGEPRGRSTSLHLNLPHAPFRLLPSGREYGQRDQRSTGSSTTLSTTGRSSSVARGAGAAASPAPGWLHRPAAGPARPAAQAGGHLRPRARHRDRGSRRELRRRRLEAVRHAPRTSPTSPSVPLFVKYPGRREGRVDRRRREDDRRRPDDRRRRRGRHAVAGRRPLAPRALRSRGASRSGSGRARRTSSSRGRRSHAGVLATARRNAAAVRRGSRLAVSDRPPSGAPRASASTASTTRQATGVAARLDGETLFADVRPASGFVPARIAGEIEAGRRARGGPRDRRQRAHRGHDADLRAGPAGRASRRSCPRRSLRDGAQRRRGLRRRRDRPGRRASCGSGAPGEVRVRARRRRAKHGAAERRRVPIADGRLEGAWSRRRSRAATVRIKGWAADVRERRIESIVSCSSRGGDCSSRRTRRSTGGTSVVSPACRGLQHVGFVAELPIRDVRGAELRAFAVRGNVRDRVRLARSRRRGSPRPRGGEFRMTRSRPLATRCRRTRGGSRTLRRCGGTASASRCSRCCSGIRSSWSSTAPHGPRPWHSRSSSRSGRRSRSPRARRRRVSSSRVRGAPRRSLAVSGVRHSPRSSRC